MVYLSFLGGVVLGSIIANILRFEFISLGRLEYDDSNPDEKSYLLVLKRDEDLSKKRKIVLKVTRK